MKTHILFRLIVGIIHTTNFCMFVEPSRAIRIARVATTERLAEELYDATLNENIETIERLAQNPLANINHRYKIGHYKAYTLLLLAVSKNNAKLCEILLKHGAYIHARSEEWRHNDRMILTPIRAACNLGFAEMATLLIKHGAHINDAEKIGTSPLHYAALEGHSALVRPFYNAKANLNEQDVDGATPLHIAVCCNHPLMAQTLLEFGAAPDVLDFSGLTPLQYAQQYDDKEMIQLLRLYSYGPELALQSSKRI